MKPLDDLLTELGLGASGTRFASHESEKEGSQTDYFYSEATNPPQLVSVKTFTNTKAASDLWDFIEESVATKGHPSMLPVKGNTRKDDYIVFNDGKYCNKVLRRLRLLSGQQQLPKPDFVLTGLAGLSRVYFFCIEPTTRQGNSELLLVKFDRTDRMKSEWESIRTLRSSTTTDPTWVLPLPANIERDGITVSPAFHGQSVYGDVVQLNHFLIDTLVDAPLLAEKAINLVFTHLESLYSGSTDQIEFTQWHSYHTELQDNLNDVFKIVSSAFPGSRESRTLSLPRSFLADLAVPNPVRNLKERLEERVGRIKKGRVHGDLQSTNILLDLAAGKDPNTLRIIDVEKYARFAPIVDDLTRIEADFWRSVYPHICDRASQHSHPISKGKQAIGIIACHDALLGISRRAKRFDDHFEKVLKRVVCFVYKLRSRAWSILKLSNEVNYWPKHYFQSLLFYYHKAVLRRMVNENVVVLNNVVTAAGLVEDTLDRMSRGLIEAGATLPMSSEDAIKALQVQPMPSPKLNAQPIPQETKPSELDMSKPLNIVRYRTKEKLPTAKAIANLAVDPAGESVAFSQDNSLFWYPIHQVFEHEVGVHDSAATQELLTRTGSPSNRITALSFTPDGSCLVSVDSNGCLRLWDYRNGTLMDEFSISHDAVTSIAFSPKGDYLVSTGYDELIRVWVASKLRDGILELYCEHHKRSKIMRPGRCAHDEERITAMALTGDGKHIATGDQQGIVVVRDLKLGNEIFRRKIHNQHVHAAAFCVQNINLLATGSDDTRIRLTDFYTEKTETIGVGSQKHTAGLNSLAFSRNGQLLVSAARDGLVKVWDVARRGLNTEVSSAGGQWIDKVVCFPNRFDFATEAYSSDISVWQVTSNGEMAHTSVRN